MQAPGCKHHKVYACLFTRQKEKSSCVFQKIFIRVCGSFLFKSFCHCPGCLLKTLPCWHATIYISDLEPDSVSRCEPIFGQLSYFLGSTTQMCSKMCILDFNKFFLMQFLHYGSLKNQSLIFWVSVLLGFYKLANTQMFSTINVILQKSITCTEAA